MYADPKWPFDGNLCHTGHIYTVSRQCVCVCAETILKFLIDDAHSLLFNMKHRNYLPDLKWFADGRNVDSKDNRRVFHWYVFVNVGSNATVDGNVYRIRDMDKDAIRYVCSRAAVMWSSV